MTPTTAKEHGDIEQVVAGLMILTANQMVEERQQMTIPAAISEGYRVMAMLLRHAPQYAQLIARWYEDDGRARSKRELRETAQEWLAAARAIGAGEMTVSHRAALAALNEAVLLDDIVDAAAPPVSRL